MFKRVQEANQKGGETIIARGVKVEGDFVSDGDVVVEGEVSGSLKAVGHLEVGDSAKIKAEVAAGEAVIAGEITGNMSVAGRLELLESAKVEGDIAAEILYMAAGAKLNGRVTMTEKRLTE